MMLNIDFQQKLCKFPTASKYKFRDQHWFEKIKCTGVQVHVCEVLQFGLGRQLFAVLPVVTEAIAGPCKNKRFSSSQWLIAPAPSVNVKKFAKILFWCYRFHRCLEEEST